MMTPLKTEDTLPFKILGFWMLFAMLTVWFVSYSGLRALNPPPLFPSARGISDAMQDVTLGIWACNISLIFGVFCSGHLSISWVKPHQAKTQNFSQYLMKLVPLAILIAGLLALMLTADLHPGNGVGRGNTLFRLLSASTLGIGILASLLTFLFGILIWILLQTVRIGYYLLRAAG